MGSIPNETFRKALLELFSEVYDGPNHSYTWFIDNAPKSGLLGTLEDITSEEASRTFIDNGSSITAHTEHLRWSLAQTNAMIRGEIPSNTWSESWLVKTVNADEWNLLRLKLRSEYEILKQHIQKQQDFSNEQILFSAFGFVAHAAYHLGAIRQMKKLVRETA